MPERTWLAAVSAADRARYYEDRRSHLVALGATDQMIQGWAQEALNRGFEVGQYLRQIEQWLVAFATCPIYGGSRMTWYRHG